MTPPRLTFYCELEAPALQELMVSQVIADLKALKASVSLGILDLSPERAEVVGQLNKAGIPVIAWLLLPKEDGYWFNIYNAAQAAARYESFKTWTAEYGLQWGRVGMDIEPDINELSELVKRNFRVVPDILRRVVSQRHLRQARQAYMDLVGQIHADGYPVDNYQLPLMADERSAHSTLIQRLGGLVDLKVDREVWMLYTSLLRPNGAGMLASYAPEAQSVGVGITGGGVELTADIPPLTWDEFSRDLRLAWYSCDDLHIFSLEGCVRQGYLERLKSFAWDFPLILPEKGMARVESLRKLLQTVLWISAHFTGILLSAIGTILFWKGVHSLLQRKFKQ